MLSLLSAATLLFFQSQPSQFEPPRWGDKEKQADYVIWPVPANR